MQKPGNMQPLAHDGELILYADPERQNGCLHDSIRDFWSDVKPLQVFFKWGNFEPIQEQPPA